MLTGEEWFYDEWEVLVRSAVVAGPVLDIGTSEPFRKEMAILKSCCPRPYYCIDMTPSRAISIVGDGQRLPVKSGSVGSVLCSHVLEHVWDPGALITEVERVLRPGGHAYFTLLDYWPYHSGDYGDYHRFKPGAVDLYFGHWRNARVVLGGGPLQVLLNYLPASGKLRSTAQRLANRFDRRFASHNTTPVRYVVATK